MSNMASQHAIVFGGESGIGKGAAFSLARRGVKVLIAGITEDAGKETEAEIRVEGLDATFFPMDVRKRETIEAAAAAARGPGGNLEIMVYACGVFDAYADVLETTEDLWDQVMEINLKGCFRASQIVLPSMIERGYGRIVTIASIASYVGTADGVAYTTSKAGMLGMVRNMGTMHADKGVTVNAVCPGAFATPLRDNSMRVLGGIAPTNMSRGVGDRSPDGVLGFIPAKRRGELHEVGELCAFLASPEAGYITGQGMLIDGGWVAA